MYYVYESHLGGYYISRYDYDYDELYCDSCGDCDFFVDVFDTIDDAEKYIEELLKEVEDDWCV